MSIKSDRTVKVPLAEVSGVSGVNLERNAASGEWV